MIAIMRTGIVVALVLLSCVLPSSFSAENNDVLSLFEQGKNCLKSGRYDEAITVLTSALELLEPDKRNAHVVMLTRAQAYFNKGELKNARDDVGRIMESFDLDGETLASCFNLRGAINRREGKDSKALDDLTAAIKTKHENNVLRSVSFANRGVVYINLGDLDKAISDLNKAIELDPGSSFAFAARGLAYLRQDKIAAAQKDTEKAMRLNPDKTAEKMARIVLDELAVSMSGFQRISVPINSSGQIFVQVRFSKNGKPHRFLLDTGATHSLIDRELLTEIKRETDVLPLGKMTALTADGSKHIVTRYKMKNAYLFNLPLGEIEVGVFDRQDRKINNLLGMNSLNKVSISLDSAARKVEIRRKTQPVDNN